MVADGLHLLFHLLRCPEVVLVADGDVLTLCLSHGTEEVAVNTHPDSIAADPELRMPCRIVLQNVYCAVGGTVVLHQYLQHGIGLLGPPQQRTAEGGVCKGWKEVCEALGKDKRLWSKRVYQSYCVLSTARNT